MLEKEKEKMKEFEKKMGFVKVEELASEADEIHGDEDGSNGAGVVSFITGIFTGMVAPTGACSSKC